MRSTIHFVGHYVGHICSHVVAILSVCCASLILQRHAYKGLRVLFT